MTGRRVLFFGTYDNQRSPRAQILREGMAALGYSGEECVVPLGFSSELRVSMLLRPWQVPLMAARLAFVWIRLLAKSRRRRADVVVVGYMGHLDVLLARLRFPRTPIVLDHLVSLSGTAADRNLKHRWFARVLAAADRAALRAADVIAVDTDEHLAELPPEAHGRGVVAPVGAQQEAFDIRESGPAPPRPPPLRVIFYGHYIPLQGAPVIGDAIAELHRRGRHDIRFTMLGRGQDLEETRRRAGRSTSVEWVDRIVEPGDLLRLVRHHHVALGVFGTNPKTAKVVPTKVFAASALGLAVVTASNPPQRRLLGDAALFVAAGEPSVIADALEQLADDPHQVSSLAKSAAAVADEHFRPASVAKPLIARLKEIGVGGGELAFDGKVPPLTINAWHRWDVIERVLDELAPRSVLEIGPGKGALAARVARRTRYVAVEIDDVSRAATAAALTSARSVGVAVADLDAAQPLGPFDMVGAFEVLEHIDDDVGALKEWRELLSSGGHVVLSVPAHRARYGAWDARVGHVRRYDRGDVEAALSAAGFEIEGMWSLGWPAGYVLETAWNAVARRSPGTGTAAVRTAGSGRNLQPNVLLGPLLRVVSLPGRWLQRRRFDSDAGTGWLVVGRAP